MTFLVAFHIQDSGQYSINTEASSKFAVVDIGDMPVWKNFVLLKVACPSIPTIYESDSDSYVVGIEGQATFGKKKLTENYFFCEPLQQA